LKTLHGTVLAMDGGKACFAKAVSYEHKTFMKLTTGIGVIENFFPSSLALLKKLSFC
jgi:hypothetical protein